MKNRDEIKSFNHAVSGIIAALKTEGHMKFHFFCAISVLVLSLFFDFNRIEFAVLALTVGLVIICEMINTAIERIIDIVSPDYHPVARVVKDIAAGAVLVSAVVAFLVGYLLFFDRISHISVRTIQKIQNSPIHLTFVALVLVVLFVVVLKTKYSKGHGTFFKGGKVSGHAAIAFCIATIISLISNNFLLIILTVFLAALVAESRIESEIHSLDEVAVGALLGIITAILIFKFFA